MRTQITNELKNAKIYPGVNMVSRIEDAIFFVSENGVEWFNENSTFGIRLREIVLKLAK